MLKLNFKRNVQFRALAVAMYSKSNFDLDIEMEGTCADLEKLKSLKEMPTSIDEIVEMLALFDRICYELPLLNEEESVKAIAKKLLDRDVKYTTWFELLQTFQNHNIGRYPTMIRYIPTDEQVEYLKKSPFSIKYIKNPTLELQLAAIIADPSVINSIDNLNSDLKDLIGDLKVLNDLTRLQESLNAINRIARLFRND